MIIDESSGHSNILQSSFKSFYQAERAENCKYFLKQRSRRQERSSNLHGHVTGAINMQVEPNTTVRFWCACTGNKHYKLLIHTGQATLTGNEIKCQHKSALFHQVVWTKYNAKGVGARDYGAVLKFAGVTTVALQLGKHAILSKDRWAVVIVLPWNTRRWTVIGEEEKIVLAERWVFKVKRLNCKPHAHALWSYYLPCTLSICTVNRSEVTSQLCRRSDLTSSCKVSSSHRTFGNSCHNLKHQGKHTVHHLRIYQSTQCAIQKSFKV